MSEKRDKEYFKKIYALDSWRSIHVSQLSYLRNLILVLSTAVLGFTVNLLINNQIEGCQKDCIVKIVCFFLFGSIFCGILMAFWESENYRLKYKIARQIEAQTSNFEKLPEKIADLQSKCSNLENRNRTLIIFELVFFIVSILTLTIVLLF